VKLTPVQVRQLQASLRFRSHPPTVWWYVRRSWHDYVYLLVLCGISIPVFLWVGWPFVSAFFAGSLFSAVVRDIKVFQQYVNTWPLSNEITDWDKVNELLRNAQSAAP
jgi:hypothetical protein